MRRIQIPAIGAALFVTIASTLRVYPHQLAYFNEFSGGSQNGHHLLLGSNLDWDQDLLYIKRWKDLHPEAKPLYVAIAGTYDPRSLGIECIPIGNHGVVTPLASGSTNLTRGWHAVSLRHLQGYPGVIPAEAVTRYRQMTPVARIGNSIHIFHVTGDKIGIKKSNVHASGCHKCDDKIEHPNQV